MVRSTFSLGGKLLTIFLTLVIFIGAIAATLVYVVTSVKVRKIAGMLGGDNWISETYDDTIVEFIRKVSNALNGEISLNTLQEISPYVGEKLNDVIDNLEKSGLFALERDALFSKPLNQLSTSVSEILIITATLNDLAETMNFTLPDLAIITGNDQKPVYVYTQVNDIKDGAIDKAFTMPDSDYSFYTRTASFTPTAEAEGETLPVATWQERKLYTYDSIALQGDFVTYKGEKIYRKQTLSYEDGTSESTYTPVSKNDGALVALDEANGTGVFALEDMQRLCVKTAPTEEKPSGYAELALPAHYESDFVPAIAAQYRYSPLYTRTDVKPSGEHWEWEGNYYVLATLRQGDSYALNEQTGGFAVDDAFQNQTLYAMEYVYTPTQAADASSETPLFVQTNGIGDLPVNYGITALSSILDTKTMTLDTLSGYFGISMDVSLLNELKYVPLDSISSSMNAELNNIYVDDVLAVDAQSPSVLLYLAYGDGYRIEPDGTLSFDASQRRTIGELTDALDTFTVSSVVGIEDASHPLLQTLANWTLADIGNSDKINSITLGDVLTIDENSPKILQVLATASLGEIGDTIDTIALGDIIDISDSDTLLSGLRDSSLLSLATDLKSLTVQKLFADDIYAYHNVGAATLYAELTQTYGAENLYVYESGNYLVYDAAVHGDHDTLYSPYLLATDLQNYADVPLYARTADGFVIATTAESWKLSAADAAATQGLTLYVRAGENDAGEPIYRSVSGNTFSTDTLYYWDSAAERMRALSLRPASLRIDEAFQGQPLFTRLTYVEAYSPTKTQYSQGNLFYYDLPSQSWKQIPLVRTEGSDPAAYAVAEGFALEEGTPLYTYGEIAGIWRYLLTKDGAEVSCNVQNIDSLIDNVQKNINALTVNDLYRDGMVEITDPSLLDQAIPYDKLGIEDQKEQFNNAETMGELRLNDLLNLTLKMIETINRFPIFP